MKQKSNGCVRREWEKYKGDTVGIDNLSMKQTREMGQGLEGDTGSGVGFLKEPKPQHFNFTCCQSPLSPAHHILLKYSQLHNTHRKKKKYSSDFYYIF